MLKSLQAPVSQVMLRPSETQNLEYLIFSKRFLVPSFIMNIAIHNVLISLLRFPKTAKQFLECSRFSGGLGVL